MGEYELYHHGIKGMKWGVRRYQNADGSLTEAGKKRQRRKEAVSKTVDTVKRKIADRKAAKAAEELRKKPLSKLTDAELEDRIKRLKREKEAFNLQNSMSNLNVDNVSRGKKVASTITNEVLVPALKNAGKEVVERWFKKQGYDLAGLKDTQYGITALAKEAEKIKLQKEMAENRKSIELVNDFFKSRTDKKNGDKSDKNENKNKTDNKQNSNKSKNDTSNKKNKNSESEKVYTGKVSGTGTSKNKKTKEKSSKPDGYYDPIEAEFVDMGASTSSVKNTSAYQTGRSYIERLLLPDDVKHSDLYHHGVKGMKWGVRKERYSSAKPSKAKSKAKIDTGRDHSKSNKSELALYALAIARDIVTLNPITTAVDVARLVQAGESFVKSKIYDKERELCKIDKKTGLRLKSKESEAQQDAARVNPLVHNFDANTKNNCMLCTTAYDLRRRGYEVRAKKASYGYFTDELKAWYPKAKIRTVVGFDEKSKPSTKDMMTTVKNHLIQQGDGARGNLMITWRGMTGGHSVAYEVQNGKVTIIDAQVNKIYANPDQFLRRCAPTVSYARLDNVPFSTKTIKEAVE